MDSNRLGRGRDGHTHTIALNFGPSKKKAPRVKRLFDLISFCTDFLRVVSEIYIRMIRIPLKKKEKKRYYTFVIQAHLFEMRAERPLQMPIYWLTKAPEFRVSVDVRLTSAYPVDKEFRCWYFACVSSFPDTIYL